MDSVTQVALGAAVGEAVLGHRVGRKALLWGAVLGTLPDLDVLMQFADPVASFTYHRGFSHSWFLYIFISPLLAWLLARLHSTRNASYKHWVLFVFLCLFTHAFLDACTVYGTQLFWPLGTPPVSWSFIFIIDPLYTLPLLVGVVVASSMNRTKGVGHFVNNITLALSTGYLVLAFSIKVFVGAHVEEQMLKHNILGDKVLTVPMPFNVLLWRIVAVNKDSYYEGYYSVFDDGALVLRRIPSDYALGIQLQDHWPVRRIKWFTHGFYAFERQGDDVVISDLRMGNEGRYPFSFKVASVDNGNIVPVAAEYARRSSYDIEDLRWVFERITNEHMVLESTENGEQ